MKKYIILTALVAMLFGTIGSINAQDNNNRDVRRQEMQTRQIERLVKDLKLEGEKKSQFEEIYKRYFEELAAARTQQTRENERDQKELTDEEATAKLNEVFARQAEQIQQQQLRLDIQKKYCAELSSILTPQQLLQVFRQQGERFGNRQGGRPQGGRGGFGGGPRGGFGSPAGGFGGPGGDF
jgi:Spy/CpxP family protein refolding chaperone